MCEKKRKELERRKELEERERERAYLITKKEEVHRFDNADDE